MTLILMKKIRTIYIESGKKTAKLLFDEFENHGYKCRKPTPIFSHGLNRVNFLDLKKYL